LSSSSGATASELQKQLADALAKLADANQTIARLEQQLRDKERDLMDERARSQKEIDRLKDMLSQTSGNL
jgi:flagellar motility protein MotE (MotC chaperone)